jgi:hypothetical protein
VLGENGGRHDDEEPDCWVKTNVLNSRKPYHVLSETLPHEDRKLIIMDEIILF